MTHLPPADQILRAPQRPRVATPGPHQILRSAYTIASTRDDAARTIEATIATQNPVMVYDWGEGRIIQEVLIVTGAKMPKWTPMLDQHTRYSLMTPGSVIGYRVEGETIRATLRFASGEDVDPIWERYRSDHLRGVSVGGTRIDYTDIAPGQSAQIAGRRWVAGSKHTLRITTRWRINETSLVIFGADG